MVSSSCPLQTCPARQSAPFGFSASLVVLQHRRCGRMFRGPWADLEVEYPPGMALHPLSHDMRCRGRDSVARYLLCWLQEWRSSSARGTHYRRRRYRTATGLSAVGSDRRDVRDLAQDSQIDMMAQVSSVVTGCRPSCSKEQVTESCWRRAVGSRSRSRLPPWRGYSAQLERFETIT